MRKLIKYCLLVLLSLGLVQPALAVDTAEIGGRSGVTYNQECGGESLVIGFEYNSGKALDSVGAICGIRRDGDWTGEIIHKGRVGGGGGSGPFTVLCPPFNAVAGVQVFIDNNNNVRHIGIGCFPVIGPELTYLGTENEGGEDATDAHSDCPPFFFASGIFGHFEALVNSVGLHCIQPPMKQAVAPAPTEQKPTPPDQPTPVVEPAKAAVDTTVYKMKGEDDPNTNQYLAAGQEVAIVKCEDQWCEISAPYSGYVWREDIKE